MSKPKGGNTMLIPTIIMAVAALGLVIIGYLKGGGQHIQGLKYALDTTMRILPLLVCAFIVAGMVQVLVPQGLIAKWIGPESGLKGIIIGSLAGGLTPGGPFVSLPVAAGLMSAGASAGTTVAFLTGWALIAINRLPMEVGILGWRFTLVRLLATALFAPVAGLLAERLWRILGP